MSTTTLKLGQPTLVAHVRHFVQKHGRHEAAHPTNGKLMSTTAAKGLFAYRRVDSLEKGLIARGARHSVLQTPRVNVPARMKVVNHILDVWKGQSPGCGAGVGDESWAHAPDNN